MAGRIRSLKPELCSDEAVASLSDSAFRLFVSAITMADDYGNLPADPRQLRGAVWWAHESSPRVAEILRELQHASLVTMYAVRGQLFMNLVNWDKHQRIDNRGKPKCPGPNDAEALHLSAQDDLLAATRGISPRTAEARGDSRLDLGSGIWEGKGREGDARARAIPPTPGPEPVADQEQEQETPAPAPPSEQALDRKVGILGEVWREYHAAHRRGRDAIANGGGFSPPADYVGLEGPGSDMRKLLDDWRRGGLDYEACRERLLWCVRVAEVKALRDRNMRHFATCFEPRDAKFAIETTDLGALGKQTPSKLAQGPAKEQREREEARAGPKQPPEPPRPASTRIAHRQQQQRT